MSKELEQITVLCAEKDSLYKTYPFLDIYDIDRDAYTYKGKNKIIAHPPCAQWSRLKGLANKHEYSKGLAPFCMEIVKNNGGIFEHPLESSIWKYTNTKPTINVQMNWFGFPVKKKTGLLFINVEPLPIPFDLNAITHSIGNSKYLLEIPKRERSKTPVAMIEYFIKSILASK